MDKKNKIGFAQSLVDECVSWCDDIIFIMCIDERMFFSNSDDALTDIIQEMKDKGLNIEDQGHPAEYVGVNIKKLGDRLYYLTQHAIINSINDDIDIRNSYTKPVLAKVLLNCMHSTMNNNLMGNSIMAQS